jgi:hypothetical protein
VIAPPRSRTVFIGILPTESIGQWTEPYTERQDPNSSRNVRLRTSYTSLLRLRVDHGQNLSSAARPYLRWLSDWRGSRHRGLQPSSVSILQLFDRVAEESGHVQADRLRTSCHRKHVIHAVGPVYQPRSTRAPLQLAGCYRISLQLAAEHGLKHIVSY